MIDAAFMTPEAGTRATLVDEERATADEHSGDPDPGDRIGRYVLLHRVGAGGMGVVFAARDPELDRTVALKVLRTSLGDRGPPARARFVREAQAMARLAHPNVAEIYDVGTQGSWVFIAMELVDGLTLSAWLKAARRPWRAIVRTFVAAGRGLAAAHAHGIVHRDFKPDNVLLSIAADEVVGVRVVDFGLAQGTDSIGPWSADPVSSSSGDATTSSDDVVRPLGHTQLTGDGCVMGTPGFMAPEQHRGRPTDPRTDQYAFCIALYEALYGSRPFQGQSLAELLHAKERGVLPPEPERSVVPPAVREALVRGLQPAPNERWPGIDPLLQRLERAMRPRRIWPWVAAAAIVAGAIVVVAQPWAEPAVGCDDPEQRVAAVWNDERRAAAASAFESIAFAERAWAHTEAALDAYAASWAQAYRSACERGTAARDADLDRRMGCLADRLDGLATIVGVIAEADAEAVHRAVGVTRALPPPDECVRDDIDDALPLPPERERAAIVVDLRRRLNRASLLDDMGRYHAAADVAESAHDQALALGWPEIVAESQVGLGEMLERTGEYKRSAALLEEGVLAAVSLGLDRVALDGITQLVFLVGFRSDDLAGAERWARQGLALLERLGEEGGATEARLLVSYGSLWDAMGDFETSRVYFERARELFEAEHGPDHPNVAAARQNLGIELMRLGDYDAARVELASALEIYRETGGASHPDTANALDNLGSALQRLGRNDEAEASTREALRIRQDVLGEHHPEVARSYTNLGAVDGALGDFAGAEQHYGRAAAIFAATLGEDNPTTAAAHVNHAIALERNGEPQRALELLHAAARRLQDLLPAEHPHHAFTDLAFARTHLALGDPSIALQHADAALAMCRASAVEPIACAFARFVRAQALWTDASRREASRREAETALTELRAAGDETSADLHEVEAWLVTHELAG